MKLQTLSLSAFLISALLLGACKTSTVSLDVLRPADITLPDHIQKVVVVNRTYPSKEDKVWNVVEGVLTGEGIGTDRRATEEAIKGMIETMRRSPRFQLVNPYTTGEKGSGTGSFPEPLPWSKVEEICNNSQADALISLEAFDSDSRLAYANVVVKEKNKAGALVDVPYVDANMRMTITNGWRLYDIKQKRILDENRSDDFMDFTSRGPNPQAAASGLPSRFNMLMQTGFRAGQDYGYRISPMWVKVGREYYKKGSEPLETAHRKVKANNWEAAADLWKREAGSSDSKVAGRACYNMAVFSEIKGNLDMAREWAEKAYTVHKNKKARNYLGVIEQRRREQERALDQMRSVEGQQP